MRNLSTSSTLTGLRLRLAFGRSAVALLAAAAVTALSPGAFANPPGNEPRPNFEFHWGVFTNPMELRWGSRTDWANQVNFDGAPISSDTIVLYEHNFVGDARSQGIAIMRTDPDFWTRVRSRLQTLLADEATRIPNAEYACLDVEFLDMYWGNRTGGPGLLPNSPHGPVQHDTWYTYMRQYHPDQLYGLSTEAEEEVLSRTYREAVQEFFTGIMREAKAVNPNLKWGFYGYPWRRYGEYLQPAPNEWTRKNDEMQWLFEQSDVVFPAMYMNLQTVADGSPDRRSGYQWEESFHTSIILANIREFRRLVGDKEIIAFTGYRYHQSLDEERTGDFCDPIDLRLALEVPAQNGLDGVIIWDILSNQGDHAAAQSYMTSSVNPLVRRFHGIADPEAPSLPPSDPGDSGGGGSPPSDPGDSGDSGDSGGGLPPSDPGDSGGGSQPPSDPGDSGGGSQPPSDPGDSGGGSQPPSDPGDSGGGSQPPSDPGDSGGGSQPPSDPGDSGGGSQPPSDPGDSGGGLPPSDPGDSGGGSQPPSDPGDSGGGSQPPSDPGDSGGGSQPPSDPGDSGGGNQPPSDPGDSGGGNQPPSDPGTPGGGNQPPSDPGTPGGGGSGGDSNPPEPPPQPASGGDGSGNPGGGGGNSGGNSGGNGGGGGGSGGDTNPPELPPQPASGGDGSGNTGGGDSGGQTGGDTGGDTGGGDQPAPPPPQPVMGGDGGGNSGGNTDPDDSGNAGGTDPDAPKVAPVRKSARVLSVLRGGRRASVIVAPPSVKSGVGVKATPSTKVAKGNSAPSTAPKSKAAPAPKRVAKVVLPKRDALAQAIKRTQVRTLAVSGRSAGVQAQKSTRVTDSSSNMNDNDQ